MAPRASAEVRVSTVKAAAPSPLIRPSRLAIEGAGRRAGVAAPRHAEDRAAHPLGRMDPRIDPAGNDHVGLAALDDPHRLGQRREARHVSQRDAIIRTPSVLADADMAGRHVRQVLQHPEWEQFGHGRRPPAAEVEDAVDQAAAEATGQLRQFAGNHAGPEYDAQAVRVDRLPAESASRQARSAAAKPN